MLSNIVLASLNATDARIIASGVIMCVIAALSIALVVLVLLQRGSGDSVSAITGGNSESFFSKTKGGGKQRILRILTIAFAVAIAVLAIVFFLVAPTTAITTTTTASAAVKAIGSII
jgi:protein translocase SecG subunit